MLQKALTLLFPGKCPICDEITDNREMKICHKCSQKLQMVTEPVCKRCGKPIGRNHVEYCKDCSDKQVHFKQGFAVWVYDDNMRRAMAKYKYDGRQGYGRFFAGEAHYYLGSKLRELRLDCLIPVPLHKNRLQFRGFNQSELVANELGKLMDLPVRTDLLIRTKNTNPQKGLSHKERSTNLSGAFEAQIGTEALHRVLLVDDIYTTGSTLEECARTLSEAGVQEIYIMCLCIGKDY